MILNNVRERYFYIRGYFNDVSKNPENYLKEDLIRYFKLLGRLFDSPDAPFDTDNGDF